MPRKEQLQPGSWTSAEADALKGRRVRFRKGGAGTVEASAGLTAGNRIYLYAVQVLPDGAAQPILLSKGDAAAGEWAFELDDDDQ